MAHGRRRRNGGSTMMRAWASVDLRAIFRPCAAHLYSVTSLAALLACFAVVLNIGPFAQPFKRDAVASMAERPSGSSAIVGLQIGSGAQLEEPQSPASG